MFIVPNTTDPYVPAALGAHVTVAIGAAATWTAASLPAGLYTLYADGASCYVAPRTEAERVALAPAASAANYYIPNGGAKPFMVKYRNPETGGLPDNNLSVIQAAGVGTLHISREDEDA